MRAVLDQERAVARHAGQQRLLLAHGVDVPQARHVDPALDRRASSRGVGRAAAARARGSSPTGPTGEPPGCDRVAGRARAVAGERGRAQVVDDVRRRRPPSISAIGAFGTPSMSNARGSVRGCAGESARLIAGAATARAQAARQRAAALGVGEAVEREVAEELEQQPDGLGLEHDRVGARPELGERLGRDLRRPRAARAPSASIARRGDRGVRRRSRCARRGRGR